MLEQEQRAAARKTRKPPLDSAPQAQEKARGTREHEQNKLCAEKRRLTNSDSDFGFELAQCETERNGQTAQAQSSFGHAKPFKSSRGKRAPLYPDSGRHKVSATLDGKFAKKPKFGQKRGKNGKNGDQN